MRGRIASFRQLRAERHRPRQIECALPDLLMQKLSVPVVFFYPNQVDHHALGRGLKQVLEDFSLFAGRLLSSRGQLTIDCDNSGASFAVEQKSYSLEHALRHFREFRPGEFVELLDARRAVDRQEPLLTVRLSYFEGGGMCLGLCWHHSLGDLHTFMQLMKAWSAAVAGESYPAPLIVPQRAAYLEEHLGKLKKQPQTAGCHQPGIRYLGLRESARMLWYLATAARARQGICCYFTPDELRCMKAALSEQSRQPLSTGNALSAHMLSLIAKHDPRARTRLLATPVNYRRRIGLPEQLLGNFVSSVNVPCEPGQEPASIAAALRHGIDHFAEEHFNYLANVQALNQRGGPSRVGRFVLNSIDPLRGTLLVTSWSKAGAYNVTFEGATPLLFMHVGAAPIPWISGIVEGPNGQGTTFMAMLPSTIAARLTTPSGLRGIHHYREPDQPLPELVQRMGWLL